MLAVYGLILRVELKRLPLMPSISKKWLQSISQFDPKGSSLGARDDER